MIHDSKPTAHTMCCYCHAIDGGHTMACQAIHAGQDMPAQVPVPADAPWLQQRRTKKARVSSQHG